jgi:hypothetical protein
MKRHTVLSVAVVLVLLVAAVAEAATVRGKVSRPDGKANSGAAVVLENAAIGATATVYTAEDGIFNLRNVPPGNYTMKVKTARATKQVPVSVPPQAMVNVAEVRLP